MIPSAVGRLSRRGVLGLAVGGVAALAAPPVLAGRGDYRRVSFYSRRTGEKLSAVYWVEGAYIPEVLDEISYVMRDWREEAVKPIAPATIDVMAAAHRLMDTTEPYELVSGYRTARTNAMLRRRSRAVAKKSYHIKAMAADLRLRSRSVEQMARAALACNAGGVGRYTRSEFVHMDSGPIRTWGR